MSSERPSALDVLMANCSKKKKLRIPSPFSVRQQRPQETQPPPKQTKRKQTKRSSGLANGSKKKKLCIPSAFFVQQQRPQETQPSPQKNRNQEPVNSLILNQKQINEAQIVNAPKNENVAAKVVGISPSESVEELKKKAGTFDPKKAGYWGKGGRVPFMFLAKTLDAISKEKGRIVITEIVCNMLRTVIETTPEDLVAVVYLLDDKIAPAHEGLVLGIGDTTIIKALAGAFGAKEYHIQKKCKELGDLGLVAKASRSSQPLLRKPEALTVTKVFDSLHVVAQESGKDSQEKKKNYIKGLLVAATDCEPQYLIRILQAKLRIGSGGKTLLTALGHAAYYSRKHYLPPKDVDSPLDAAAKILKQVYSVIPVYEKIIPALLADGLWDLPKTCTFTVGVPVAPMLAKPIKGVSEILDKLKDTEFTCEYKYDGERAQIHFLENGSVEIYSRNAQRNTGKYPDVVEAIKRLKESSVTSFVLDCELVAYDREKKRIQPFQVLGTRARKNVTLEDIKNGVCIYAFDILYLNGQTLLPEQLDVRRQLLYKSFKEEPGFFQFATAITSNDLEVIQKFLEDAVDACCEGLIIKTLKKGATYEPTERSRNWLKLKKDYIGSIGDSLDLVPIAAFHGCGNRTGVYGSFLMACYDNENEEFQSICKLGTGFSTPMLEELSVSLKVIEKPKSYYRYRCSDKGLPDVWFECSQVWEVKGADLTISPDNLAAIGIVDFEEEKCRKRHAIIIIRTTFTTTKMNENQMKEADKQICKEDDKQKIAEEACSIPYLKLKRKKATDWKIASIQQVSILQ